MRDTIRALDMALSPAAVLAIAFAALYLAVGPGSFFSVDEVSVLETGQAILDRGSLEVPANPISLQGVAGAFYSVKPPALTYVSLPTAALGSLLDEALGSMKGGTAQGPPRGTAEHPLRWGGRLAIFASLATNAVLGGTVVALLFLIGRRLGAGHRACLLMALVSGLATLLASESTHLFRHPLEAGSLLLGFWFFSDDDASTLVRRTLLGAASLGIAILAGPNTVGAAAVLWLYGMAKAWKATEGAPPRARSLVFPALSGSVPLTLCLAIYLCYNHVRFGSVGAFGYTEGSWAATEGFHLSLGQVLQATAAYLASPTLSIFLFAPPLLLAIPALIVSLRRWPLEARTLLWAAGAHFALVVSYRFWHGAVSYGPRYMLVSTLLLMPLTLPVFERISSKASRGWRATVTVLFGLGLLVQALGLVVYVTTNEWARGDRRLDDTGWVFVASLSPPWVHLHELLAGRNLIPWGLRAIQQPGVPLVCWILLVVLAGGGAFWLWRFYRGGEDRAEGTRLPEGLVLTLAFLIGIGLLLTGRVREPLPERVLTHLNEGMAAHREGRSVRAEELYALVLGLEPRNKHALYDLGLLHEAVGQSGEAVALFQRVVALDPGYTPASDGLARLGGVVPPTPATEAASAAAPVEGEGAEQCYARGKRSWDLGDKRAAVGVWEECGRKFEDQPVFLKNVALGRYDLGDFEGAVRDYRAAAEKLSGDLGLQTDLAWALLRAGRLAEARRTCEGVLQRDPGNAGARAVLGQLEVVAKGKTE